MTEERDTFEATRARLEEITQEVRKRDTSLDASIELLEESVRLANQCTEQVDQVSWTAAAEDAGELEGGEGFITDATGEMAEVVPVDEVARAEENADDSVLDGAWAGIDDPEATPEPVVSEDQEVLDLADDTGDETPGSAEGDGA